MKLIFMLPFLLGSIIAGVNAYWHNGWDGVLTFVCPKKNGKYQAIKRIESKHDNHREDRIWHFDCADVPKHGNCAWTDWLNGWDGQLSHILPRNAFLVGVHSYHHNKHEDRRWKFAYCESLSGLEDCKWTAEQNGWDGHMNYRVPQARVIHGAYSYHHNRHEDRIWKFYECGIKQCEVTKMHILSKPPATMKGIKALDVQFDNNCSPNEKTSNFRYVKSFQDTTTISNMEKFDFEYSSEITVTAGGDWLGGSISSKIGFKAGYGYSLTNTRSKTVDSSVWSGTENKISPYSAGMGLALAVEYEYAGTRVPVDYTIQCGNEKFTERKYVKIEKHTYNAKTTDFNQVTYGKSSADCKSKYLHCMLKIDASNALFKHDVLKAKFEACFKGHTAYPTLQLSSTGFGRDTNKRFLGTYQPINEVINGKPVWKHTASSVKLFSDAWGGWRVGPSPNHGYFTSASGENAPLPTAITGKWYVYYKGWKTDSTMRLVVVSNRGLDFQNRFNSTDFFELEDRTEEEEDENPVFDGEFVSDYEHDEDIDEDLISKLIADEREEDPKTEDGEKNQEMPEEK